MKSLATNKSVGSHSQ